MTESDNVATNPNCNFQGVGVFVFLRKQFAEKDNKSYHVYKVIVVLHIYNKSLVIR